jgi:small-conductance mechanosensitive channel
MSEPFEFDVAYSTTFEQLEKLREKMLAFVVRETRDFLPAFDVTVVGMSFPLASAGSLTRKKTFRIRKA